MMGILNLDSISVQQSLTGQGCGSVKVKDITENSFFGHRQRNCESGTSLVGALYSTER